MRVAWESVTETRGESVDEGTYRFRGLASRTGVTYEVNDYYGSYRETINPGAFRVTLQEDPMVHLLVEHAGLPLASTRSGTLRLAESERGLEVEAELDMDDPRAQTVRSTVGRGDTEELSFAFRVTGQVWSDDYMDRTITGVNLHRGDVSLVGYGANPYTSTKGHDDDDYMDDDPMDDDHRNALLHQQQLEAQWLESLRV